MLPKVVDVTAITGKHIVGPMSSWQIPNGPYLIEHLSGKDPNGDLLVFYWMPGQDWKVVNVTQKTGQKVTDSVISWVINNVEHLAGQGPNNSLFVFSWAPSTNWRVVNVSKINGEKVDGVPTAYQLSDGKENVELLGEKSLDEPIKF